MTAVKQVKSLEIEGLAALRPLAKALQELTSTQTPSERERDEEKRAVRASMQPVIDQADEAAKVLEQRLRACDREMQPVIDMFPYANSSPYAPRGLTVQLDSVVMSYRSLRAVLSGLRAVGQDADHIVALQPWQRQSASEELRKRVSDWATADPTLIMARATSLIEQLIAWKARE